MTTTQALRTGGNRHKITMRQKKSKLCSESRILSVKILEVGDDKGQAMIKRVSGSCSQQGRG